jgi:hypothetical protein
MCFLAIWISSFEKVLFGSIAHFFIGSLILGEFSFLTSLYILVISPSSDVQPQAPHFEELFCYLDLELKFS